MLVHTWRQGHKRVYTETSRGPAGWMVHRNSVLLCNFYMSLELFQNKK